jgi:hypothetical protein
MHSNNQGSSIAMEKEIKEVAAIAVSLDARPSTSPNAQMIPKSASIPLQKSGRQRSQTFSSALKAESSKGSTTTIQRGMLERESMQFNLQS